MGNCLSQHPCPPPSPAFTAHNSCPSHVWEACSSLLLLSETLGVCLAGVRAGIGWRGLAAQTSVAIACSHAPCLSWSRAIYLTSFHR